MQAVASARGDDRTRTPALLIAVTFFVAFGIKLGLFPFHFWLPTVYLAVAPHVAAMLAGRAGEHRRPTGCCASGARSFPASSS